MAAIVVDAADLDVVARAVMFGPRGLRLDVVNMFRVANGKAEEEYLVNNLQPHQEAVDVALDNAMTGASAGDVYADTADFEVLFTAALFGPRENRINIVNVAREALGLDAIDYLVNAAQPHQGLVDTALANIEALL
jgi:hypothetical protein